MYFQFLFTKLTPNLEVSFHGFPAGPWPQRPMGRGLATRRPPASFPPCLAPWGCLFLFLGLPLRAFCFGRPNQGTIPSDNTAPRVQYHTNPNTTSMLMFAGIDLFLSVLLTLSFSITTETQHHLYADDAFLYVYKVRICMCQVHTTLGILVNTTDWETVVKPAAYHEE